MSKASSVQPSSCFPGAAQLLHTLGHPSDLAGGIHPHSESALRDKVQCPFADINVKGHGLEPQSPIPDAEDWKAPPAKVLASEPVPNDVALLRAHEATPSIIEAGPLYNSSQGEIASVGEPQLEPHLANALNDACSIHVGMVDCIPRWKIHSVITFNGSRKSFPLGPDYDDAMDALNQAANKWNALKLGVSFKPIGAKERAVFQLVYQGGTQSSGCNARLALAFLPHCPPAMRKLVVYPLSFREPYRSSLINIFLHELGHILGLRHEFATSKEANLASVQIGEADGHSVMNYYPHPAMMTITELDKKYIREFYALKGSDIQGMWITDVSV